MSTTRRAMILAEIIIAVVLLASALAVILSMAGRALSAQRTGERLQTAAMLLDEQLNLVLARGPDDYSSAFETQGVCEPPFADYRFALEIAGGTGGDAYSVTATISWMDGGRPQSATAQTLIAPRLGEDPDPDRRPPQAVERSGL